ncbi:MAG: DNA cytosine methyltransferase [Thalassovita sp.]
MRQLTKAGHIAPGVVDTRDIRDISPDDLKQYTQLHFFAGIGGWSLALRQAGWPDDRPVWTGSCPCQPFSSSGQQRGFDDDRHLWPVWFKLIKACQPTILFGEQVAAKPALAWFDLVSADLENTGYIIGAADLCAASLGAPHIRQRLWFGAELHRLENADGACVPDGMQDVCAVPEPPKDRPPDRSAGSDRSGGLGDANSARSQGRSQEQRADKRLARTSGLDGHSPWKAPDWI